MTVKFETLKPGDVLYDCGTHGVGNTTARAMGCWKIDIVSIDPVEKSAIVRWNGNAPKKQFAVYFGHHTIRRWPPEWVSNGWSGEKTCKVCHCRESKGHAIHCEHPKAVKARSKVTV